MRLIPQFLLSAVSEAQFPAPSAPEVAFLGRSNVGKSSLINALLGEGVAKVSATPGRTRAINFFALLSRPQGDADLVFADLPGYGYAKISRSISAEWPSFIEPYLQQRPTLALCVCLVDLNIPPQNSDLALQEVLARWQRPVCIVGTKSDRLSGNKLSQSMRALSQAFGGRSIVPCSAETKRGLPELWQNIYSAAGI